MSDFIDETRASQVSDSQFTGILAPNWNIGDNPNGGYMVACALQALRQVVPHPDPVSVTTHYLRPGLAGQPFTVNVEVVRTGRTLSTVRGELEQAGSTRILVQAAFADLDVNAGIDHVIAPAAPEMPSPDACVQRSEQTQGIALPILSRLDTRIHPQHARAGENPRAELGGYIRFADQHPPDSLALALFADAFPPSVLPLLGVIGWVPTLELTVHIRRKPVPGWIQAHLQCDDLQNGRMIESGQLWDADGHLVAQSRQLGLVMHKTD